LLTQPYLTNLREYLAGKNGAGLVAGSVAKNAIIQAYEVEYGLDAEQQSCLNFLLFIHADKRSKFTPFGVFSDEHYHVLGGNDQIVDDLASELANQIHLEMRLVKVRKTSAGSLELTFKKDASTLVKSMTPLYWPFRLRYCARSIWMPVSTFRRKKNWRSSGLGTVPMRR
jgi:monoamine oxidase